MTIKGPVAKKIKDFKIDGKDAFYTQVNMTSNFELVVSIDGKKRYVSIILKSNNQEALGKHKAEFEAAVDTFKFNSFSLD